MKTKKRKIQNQSKSLFGINDCHKPKRNTKKSYVFNKINSKYTKKTIKRKTQYS
jgi:hypothetical protein